MKPPTAMHRQTTMLALALAAAMSAMASLTVSGAGTARATLTKIASRIDDRAGIVAIEASAPVAYVAAQPDPRSFVVELRNIESHGFRDSFKPDPRHPFSAVTVEGREAADGARVARVRLTLSQPLRPRVRSSRNIIYVEADRLDRTARTAGVIATAGPATAIHHVQAARRGASTAVTLYGSGRLTVFGVEAPQDGPPRVVLYLPNAVSAMRTPTVVREDPVEAVRIRLNPKSAFDTQVEMALTRRAPYRVETSPDGREVTVLFDPPPPTASATAVQALPLPTASMAQASPALMATARQAVIPPAPTPPAAEAAAGAATQQPITVRSGAPAPQRFTGFPISLDFQGADLRAVLRTFAEISGLNIVIDPTIQGTVDVSLRDVPWDQALDIILRANRLGYTVEGTVVRIVPLTVLAQEQAERQKLAEAQALAGELQTLTRTLSYARAENVQPLLTATVLSQRGSITTDARTNTLIITDLPERLARAVDLISTIDRPEPQVEIEARIVQTTRDFARRLGIQWGGNARAATELGNTLPLGFPNQAAVGGRTGGGATGAIPPGTERTQGPTPADAASTVVNLPVVGATTGIGLALGAINGALNLDVVLSALESSGQGRLLSTPRVTTQNNIEAQITQGIQIPIQTVANNTVTVTFRDAALSLLVTPQITAANTVIMRITVENASPDFSRSVNGIPPIDTQRALTQVLVNNGETTVIGGIYVSREQSNQGRTPGLYRIPLLGWLFQRNEVTDESRELLIFITPRIIRL